MKKILLSFVFVAFAAGAFAQKNVIKTNFIGLFASSYTLAYERVLNEKMAVQLSVGYRSYKFANVTIGSWSVSDSYSGPTIVGEFKYYLTNASKDVPRGFYVAPFVRYSNYTSKVVSEDSSDPSNNSYNYTTKYSTSSIAGGVALGIQWLIGDKFAIDLFAGPQYKTRSVSDVTTEWADGTSTSYDGSSYTFANTKGLTSGVGLRAGVTVGYAF